MSWHLVSQVFQIVFVAVFTLGATLVLIHQRGHAVMHMIIGILMTLAMSFNIAKADTIWLDKVPSSRITAGQASKAGLAADGKVWRCRAKRTSPKTGNPINAKGSADSFHQGETIGKDMENGAELLADGKSLVQCDQVYTDRSTKRIKKL